MGGEDVGILGVVRALASAHYEPWLAVPHAGTYPSRSRACAGTDVVPDPRGGVDGFVEAIVDVAVRRQVRLVLPSTDVAVMELARHRDAFPEGIRLAVDPPEVVDAAMDKPLLSRLAREAGLAAPPGRVLAASEVGAADFEFDFPVAVKPLRSELRTPEGTLVRHRVSKAGDPLELRRALSALPGGRGLVERYLDGAVGGIAGVMWHGQLRGAVMVDARRMWPRDCGLFSYAVTAPSAPGFERAVETLLATLGVNGVFELDFVAHGGRRYVIDLNPRFFTSIALPVSAGLNLPAIWCDLLLGDAPVIPAHRVGARFRHEQNDIRALLDSAASGHPVAAVPGLLPHAGTAHALFSLRDPRPVLASIGKLRGHLKSKARRGPVTTTGDASPPAREWDELADRTGAPPFLRPGWLEAWWRAFGNGALEVTAVRRDGRLVAVMPLYRPGRRSAPYKVEPFPVSARRRTLRATANWHTPLHGPLAEDDEALEQLAAAVVGAGASLLSLGFPPAGATVLEPFRTAARRAGYRLHEVRLPPVPYVAVDGDWPGYERQLSSRLLRDLRRRRRKLETQGTVAVQVLDGRERLGELLAEGFRLESSGWKATGGSAILSRPATQRFYTDVARWASDRGWLRLAFLRVDERPIAFQLGIEEGGTYYFLKGGYDPAYQAAAPAKLLLQAMLQRAHALGLDRFDFVGGDEPWKLEWTDSCRERVLLHAFAPSAAGALERGAVTLGRPARARVRSSLRPLRPAVARLRRWRHRV